MCYQGFRTFFNAAVEAGLAACGRTVRSDRAGRRPMRLPQSYEDSALAAEDQGG
jgi:hypothetical protein